MNIFQKLFFAFGLILLIGCQPNQTTNQSITKAYVIHAKGDVESIDLAKKVMQASGTIEQWKAIPVITWNFFGRRILLWNKENNLVRIDFTKQDLSMWVNLNNDTIGQVKINGQYLQGDSLQDFLNKAKSIFINDSYWLCFPFKLLDKGVTLTKGAAVSNMLGESSQTFWMDFTNVGNTPNNRYQVYVSDSTQLINQWDFYRDSASVTPDLSTTFEMYNTFSGVLLSQKRSGFELSDIQTFTVFDSDTLKDLMITPFW